MEKQFWDTQIDYLKTTRAQMWNDDYLEFLIKYVWKIDALKHIVDFGCGYGYLGMKLLPLLPEGSTYTGIDIGEDLLCEAGNIFNKTHFQTDFINIDLTKYIPHKQYDIAICQAVLRHIPRNKEILSKMVDSVVPGGMVICIEVNRKMEEAGMYIHGSNRDTVQDEIALKIKWEDEFTHGGRDYLTGIKIPIYMEELGLINVGVRINDFAEFISPYHDEYKRKKESFMKLNNIIDIEENDSLSFLQARSLVISYGIKQ